VKNINLSFHLSFRKKILIYFFISLFIGFAIINFVSLKFLKERLEENLANDILLLERSKDREIIKETHPFIKISKDIDGDFKVIKEIEDGYLLVEKRYINKQLEKYFLTIITWELMLIVILSFIVYKIISFSIKKEEDIKETLEVFVLAFTHKLKNFLAIQKINIEILKARCQDVALDRLEKAYILIEKDFEILIQTLKALREFKENIEEINIKEITEEVIRELEKIYPEKSIFIKISDFKVRADRKDLKNILFVILENSFKYSKKNIFVVGREEDKENKENNFDYILEVRNDIDFREKGSGVGLEIAKFLAKKYGWELEGNLNVYKTRYIVKLKIKRS